MYAYPVELLPDNKKKSPLIAAMGLYSEDASSVCFRVNMELGRSRFPHVAGEAGQTSKRLEALEDTSTSNECTTSPFPKVPKPFTNSGKLNLNHVIPLAT